MTNDDFIKKLEKAIKFARISRIARLTRMDYLGLPVFQCTRPFSRNMVTSQGKGFTEEHAKIAAIMESLEAFHGEGVPIDKQALFSEIAPELTYDLKIITPNIPDAPIKWTKAFDLIQEKHTYLPHALICMDFSDAYLPDLPIAPSSNGYGGGSSKESALQHAILEVLERHIVASIQPDYVPLNAEIDALLQPYFGKLRERHFKMGIFYHSNNEGLPTFKINIQEPGKENTHFGMSCHPDKNTALIKAFCEALQSRVTFISGARDDIESYQYSASEDVIQLQLKITQYSDIPTGSNYTHLSEKERVEFLINKSQAFGFKNLIVVDLTKKEIEIPIVVAVIPGSQINLEHHGGPK